MGVTIHCRDADRSAVLITVLVVVVGNGHSWNSVSGWIIMVLGAVVFTRHNRYVHRALKIYKTLSVLKCALFILLVVNKSLNLLPWYCLPSSLKSILIYFITYNRKTPQGTS